MTLVGTREWFEKNTQSGQWIEFATYDIIEYFLASRPIPQNTPSPILDLSELKTEPIQGAQKGEEVTPRNKRLKGPLEKLVNLAAEAIAVDVDFSPKETYRTLDDPCFCQFCLKLRKAGASRSIWRLAEAGAAPPAVAAQSGLSGASSRRVSRRRTW